MTNQNFENLMKEIKDVDFNDPMEVRQTVANFRKNGIDQSEAAGSFRSLGDEKNAEKHSLTAFFLNKTADMIEELFSLKKELDSRNG